jgi:HD-like signal output (HDOD) protein
VRADPDLFVSGLLGEIDGGEVRLPSFPDVSVRVQRVLDDPKAAPAKIARVVGADAALAARVLRLANSSFLNPSGTPIKDLPVAVTRLGHQLVRCTALSFALQQMDLGTTEAGLKSRLRSLWQEGTLVASIAYVLARATRAANADEALLTGLLHNIGDLYLAVKAAGAGGTPDPIWAEVVRRWRPRIARAILKQWSFPPAIVAAVAAQNATQPASAADTPADGLTDVLAAAIALLPAVFDRDRLAERVASVPAFARFGIDGPACDQFLVASAEQIRSLRAALSG